MGDLERVRSAERRAGRAALPGAAREHDSELLRLQALAGNAAVGGLLAVQRVPTLDAELASLDDDRATMAAVNAAAERGEGQDAFDEGRAAFRRHDYLQAADQFEQGAAVASGSARDTFLRNAAEAYERQGDTLGVPGAGDVRSEPGHVQAEELAVLVQAGADAFGARDFAGALRLFQQVYDALPTVEVAWNMAMAEFRLGSYADARDHFGDYERRGTGSENAAPWIERCEHELAGSSQISQRDLAALGESDAESLSAVVDASAQADLEAGVMGHFGEGARLYRGDDFIAAAREFLEAGVTPDDPRTAWNAGRAFQRAGRYQDAVESYRRAFGR